MNGMLEVAPDSHTWILHRISTILSSELTIDEMLAEIIKLTVDVTECDACLVYLIDRATDEVILRASQLPHASELGRLRMKIGEGVTGWVAEHKSLVALSSNAGSDTRFRKFPNLIEDTYEAFLSVPLVSAGEVIGVVNVHHRDKHEHKQHEIALLVFVGEQLGAALAKNLLAEENIRLVERTAQMEHELETRKLVERAKGILQKRHNLGEEEAYLRLRNQSRRLRRRMRDLAEAIILAEDLSREGEPGL